MFPHNPKFLETLKELPPNPFPLRPNDYVNVHRNFQPWVKEKGYWYQGEINYAG